MTTRGKELFQKGRSATFAGWALKASLLGGVCLAALTQPVQAQFVCVDAANSAQGSTAAGSVNNVACGINSNANGTTSFNYASGNGANASGNDSTNVAVGWL